MGIQSTIEITRDNAERKAVQIYFDKNKDSLRGMFEVMKDEELEDYIDEHFYNYKII